MDSREAPGASTLREMSTELIALLIHAVGELEQVINEAIMLYAMFKLGPERGKSFAGRITLSRDITADDVNLQIQMFLTYRDEIRNVQSWRKAHLKKVAVSMGYNNDERSEILQDIEKIEPLPQFNQTALPRGLTASGTAGQEVNVPLPEPRVRDSNGQ
jgi:DNA polymerase III alpha subunit (gram-positive type)